MTLRAKIRGVFYGTAVGDALGMPVETFSLDRIRKEHGRITEYRVPSGHKWFDGEPAGLWTDDTQLTLAVAEGLMEAGLSMDSQVKYHVAAFKESTRGWGRSTRESIRNIANGSHWEKSGNGGTGVGNGVPMKIAPVGLLIDTPQQQIDEFVVDLSMMTHQTSLSASSAFAQVAAVGYCARNTSSTFDPGTFIRTVVVASKAVQKIIPPNGEDDLSERLELLSQYKDYDTDRMVEEFGAGSCYCFNSLPFTYMHFVKNWKTVDSLYDVVSAGGDTDSNGAMLGALLGVLHGEDIFPKFLLDGLQSLDRIEDTANRFADWILHKPKKEQMNK